MRQFLATTVAACVFFSANAYADQVVKTFKSDDVKRLNLKNTSGDSLLVGRKLSEVKVTVERIKWNDKCKLEIAEKSGTLFVEVLHESSSFSFFSNNECRANINVTLPLEADVELKSGSGDISIADLIGKFDVEIGSGNLKIETSQVSKLLARSGSGDLKVAGEIGDADIKVGSGDVSLIYRKAPLSGEVTIKSGSGDATVALPKESKIKVDFKAGSGRLSNELDNLQNAQYRVSMKAGSGNLNVKKL